MLTLTWINDVFAWRLSLALLHFLWQGCAVAAVCLAGNRLLRRASAQWRYALHVSALLIMAACLPVTMALLRLPATTAAPAPLNTAAPIATAHGIDVEAQPAIEVPQPLPIPAQPVQETTTSNATDVGRRVADGTFTSIGMLASLAALPRLVHPYAALFAMLYGTCVAVMLCRLSCGLWGGRNLRRAAAPVENASLLAMLRRQARRIGLRSVPLLACCQEISVPVVLGVLRPVILLPAALISGLSPAQLEALIAHELAHIHRFDLLVNLLQRLIESLLFFHPAVWLISRRISEQRELAADDLVLSAGWRRAHYADALLRMAELSVERHRQAVGHQAAALAASGARPSDLKRRVLRLLERQSNAQLRLTGAGLLLALGSIALLLICPVVLAAWTINAQPPGAEINVRDASVTPPERKSRDAHDEGYRTADKNLQDRISPNDPPIWARATLDPHWQAGLSPVSPIMLDDRQMLVGEEIVDVRTGILLAKLPLKSSEFVPAHVALAGGRKMLAVCGAFPFAPNVLTIPSWQIQVWDIESARQVGKTVITDIEFAFQMAVSGDGKYVAAGNREYVAVWEVATGHMKAKTSWQLRNVDALALSPDGKQLVISDQNDLVFWNWQTRDEPLKLHAGRRIISLAFSPDGRKLAEGPDVRRDIQIRDMQSMEVVHSLQDEVGSPLMVYDLEFSADGRALTAGNAVSVDESKLKIPHRLFIWDVATGQMLRQIAVQSGPMGVSVSPSGRHLAARLEGSEGSVVAVWAHPQTAAPQPNDGGQPQPGAVPATAPTICGLSLEGVPNTLDRNALADLVEADPEQPGRMRRRSGVLTMPIYESQPYAILSYPVRLKRFYVEVRERGNVRRIYGPIEGDPFEKLNLDASMRKQLQTANESPSDALLRLRGMLARGDDELLARAFAMMEEIPQPNYRHRNMLDSLIEVADEALQRIENPQLQDTARKSRMRVVALGAGAKIEWQRRRVELDNSEYAAGADEAPDPSIVWGTADEQSGLQVGFGPKLNAAAWRYGDTPEIALWVRNTGSEPIRFSSTDRVDEGVRLWLVDANGERYDEYGIGFLTTPLDIRRFQLAPGQHILLKKFLISMRPLIDADMKRGGFAAAPGRYALEIELRIAAFESYDKDGNITAPAAGEWTGTLTARHAEPAITVGE